MITAACVQLTINPKTRPATNMFLCFFIFFYLSWFAEIPTVRKFFVSSKQCYSRMSPAKLNRRFFQRSLFAYEKTISLLPEYK